MDEPRTHYQISLTSRQAIAAFFGFLLALGLAFFFGLMSGLSGRASPAGGRPEEAPSAEATPVAEAPPLVETAVPTAKSSGPSRTEIASGTPAEPTVPATIQAFGDSTAEEPAPEPAAKAPAAPKPSAAAGRVWVQVASLSSREEASALNARLSKSGYRVAVSTAPSGKGKIYRVRVGPYGSPEEAERAASRLAKQEKIRNPWVVPEGK